MNLNFKSPHPKTYIFDLDGTILQYNLIFTEDRDELLPGVQELWDSFDPQDMIILTTARPEYLREHTEQELTKNGIPYHRLIMQIERGPRYLINDMDPKAPGKRAIAINVKRDKGI